MIARAWHGVTDATKSDQYLEYLTGIPDVGSCGCPDVTVVEGQSSGLVVWGLSSHARRTASGCGCSSSRGMRIIGEVALRATIARELEPQSLPTLPQDIEH